MSREKGFGPGNLWGGWIAKNYIFCFAYIDGETRQSFKFLENLIKALKLSFCVVE